MYTWIPNSLTDSAEPKIHLKNQSALGAHNLDSEEILCDNFSNEVPVGNIIKVYHCIVSESGSPNL